MGVGEGCRQTPGPGDTHVSLGFTEGLRQALALRMGGIWSLPGKGGGDKEIRGCVQVCPRLRGRGLKA